MPRVPQVTGPQQSLRGVDNRGLNFRAESTDFGMGEAVQRVGGVAADVLEDQQRENRKTLLEEFGTAAYQWETQNIQGEALQKRGKDALGLSQTYTSTYDEWLGEYVAQLPEEDRELVQLAADARRAQVERTLVQHTGREWEAYQTETAEAYQSSELDAAIAYWDDPTRVEQSRANLKASVRANGKTRGESPEVTQRKLEKDDSVLTHGVLKQMVANGQVGEARRYLEKRGDLLVGEEAVSAQKMVKDAEVRQSSQMQADAIVEQHDNLADALKAARGIQDAEIRDSTVTRVNQRFAEKEAARKRQEEESFRSAQATVEQTGDIDSIDPGVWIGLSNAQQSALESRARQVREKQVNGGLEPVTNRVAMSKWVAMAAEEPSEFVKMDPYEVFRPHTSDADYQRLVGLHQSITNGRDADLSTTNTIPFNTRVLNAAQRAGVVPVNSKAADWNDTQAQRYQRFMERASLEIEDYERKIGRKSTTNEQQEIINGVMVNTVFLDEWGSDPEVPVGALSVDELGKAYIPYAKIPQAERTEIEDMMRANGLAVDQEMVQRLAAAYAAGDRAMFMRIMSGEL